MKQSLTLNFDQGLDGLVTAFNKIPNEVMNFKMAPVTEWRGYGAAERQVTVGVEFSWEAE